MKIVYTADTNPFNMLTAYTCDNVNVVLNRRERQKPP